MDVILKKLYYRSYNIKVISTMFWIYFDNAKKVLFITKVEHSFTQKYSRAMIFF